MATDVERLIVALEARTKAFESALARANGTADKRARAIESRFLRMNKTLGSQFNALQTSAVRAFALIGGAAGAKSLIDSSTKIENALKVAGLSGEELTKTYDALFAAAQRNAAPIESLVQLYSRVSLVQGELGVSSDRLVQLSDNVGKALRLSGADAQEASGALLQLSQALGSGKIQSEEYNSLIDGLPGILQAAAAGIEQASGSVSKLTQLVKSGKISNKAFFDGIEAGAYVLDDRLAGATDTIDQRFTKLRNALTDAAGRFNRSSQAANTFGRAIDNVTDFVNHLDFENLISEFNLLLGAIDKGIAGINSFANAWGRLSGLSSVGEGLVGLLPGDTTVKSYLGGALTVSSTDAIQRRIDEAFSDQLSQVSNLTEDAIKGSVLSKPAAPKGERLPANPNSRFKPIDINDDKYKPTDNGSGSGGRSKAGRSRQDDYQRELEQIKERTAAIQAETAAMAQLNPLVDDYGYSVDFARTKQDLLTAAQKAGVAVTPSMLKNIDAMAKGYADATSAAERLDAAQRKARETADFFAESAYEAFSDLIPQIETGNKVLDKFLNTLIEAVAQSALLGKGPLAGVGSGGGFLGGLFSVFGFANGGIAANGKPLKRFAGGGISRTAAIFGEAGPEAAVPLPDGRRIPVDIRGTKQMGRGGNDTLTINLQADRSIIAETADQRIQTASGQIVKVAVSQSTQRVVPTMAAYQNNKAGAEWR